MKAVSTRCPDCRRRVLALEGKLYDTEPVKILTPGDDGLWEFVDGHVRHECGFPERWDDV